MTDQEKDPVVHSSLSKPLFISSALLVVCLGWALYDEVYGTRPWKGYEARFEKLYSRFLKQPAPREAALGKQIKASAEYQKLDREMKAAEDAVAPQVGEIDRKVNQELVPRILALNDPFQEVRGHIGSLTYQIEITKSESSKDSLRKEIAGAEARKSHTVSCPRPTGPPRNCRWTSTTWIRPCRNGRRKSGAAAEARGSYEARPPNCEPSATSILPIASPTSAPIRWPACRTRWQTFDIAHPPDPCQGCRPGGPLRILPPGHARAGHLDQSGHGRRRGLHQPSGPRAAEGSRPREVRLHALPRRQWRGLHQRRKGARLQRTLALAAARARRTSKPAASSATPRKSSPRWPTR